MNREKTGIILAVIAAIISGFSIFANKIFIVSAEPVAFTFIRSLIIGAVFLGIIMITKNKKNKKQKTNWKALVAIGLIGGAIAFVLFFSGLKMTTAGRAAFIHKTLPLYVLVLAFVFLKEKITEKHFYSIFIMLIGLVAMNLSSLTPEMAFGDVLVLMATICWAVEIIISKKAMNSGSSSIMVMMARMLLGSIFIGIFIFATGSFAVLSMNNAQLANVGISTAILFMYVFFFYTSLKYINASKSSTILLLAPVITLLLGIFILGEPAPALQLVGSALILVGAYFVANERSEHPI